MEKAYLLADKILKDIEKYSEENVSEEGKTITTNEALQSLNNIIEEGFGLYKYLVEKKYYEGKDGINACVCELEKYISQLQINPENAKKLHLSNVMQIWNQAKLAIALLACSVLDYRDEQESE